MNNAVAAAAGANGALDIALAREEALAGFSDINWGTYLRSGGFSLEQEDVDVLRSMEALEKQYGNSTDTLNQQTDEFLVESGSTIASALLKLVGNVTEASVVKYALARMQTLLADGVRQRKRMAYFVKKGETLDAAPFLRRIRDEKGYIQAASANLLALFLTVYPSKSDIQALVEWGVKELQADDGAATRASVNCMMVLLRSDAARSIFAKAGGVSAVVDLLKTSRAQQAYELTFILWALSYNEDALEKFVTAQAITALIEQVNAAPREKVVRVALETLNNMVGKREGFFNERMIDGGLLKTLTNMRDRKWTDEDIIVNVQKIRDVLIREYKELNTMERYEKELRTGTLNWGLLHTDKFWKENFMQFEAKEFQLIRLLIDLLDSEDSKTVAVALYDLGEFVRFYPNGKHISKRLGAKKAAMKLMTHDNPEVQKQALQCISKMMVNKWEFVK